MSQKPSVGRIVHYYPTESSINLERPYAAIITRVWVDDRVSLRVFDDHPDVKVVPSLKDIPRSEEPWLGRWMWPPRV